MNTSLRFITYSTTSLCKQFKLSWCTLSSEGNSIVHSHSACLNVIPENLTLTADILSSSLPSECSSSTSRASVKGCAPPFNPVRYTTWQATSSAATCQMQMQSPPPTPPSVVQVQRAMIIKSWTDWPASHTPRSSHALWQWMHTAPHSTAKRATCRVAREWNVRVIGRSCAARGSKLVAHNGRADKQKEGQQEKEEGAQEVATGPSVSFVSPRKCEFDLLWTCNAAYAQYLCYQLQVQAGQLNKSNKNT